jgi:hypothetical protein
VSSWQRCPLLKKDPTVAIKCLAKIYLLNGLKITIYGVVLQHEIPDYTGLK